MSKTGTFNFVSNGQLHTKHQRTNQAAPNAIYVSLRSMQF